MTSKRTIHKRLHDGGLVPLKDVWLTPERKAEIEAEYAANRAKALGEERKDD